MRIGNACVRTGLALGVLTTALAAAPAGPPLAPLVYVCPMPADASVIADKPGKCPVCGMTLVATRLDAKYWCPTHQTLVVRDGPGKCPIDGKALVQVTVAEHWICSDEPDRKLDTPRTCGNGQPSTIVYEARAHGDHNPRHDGQFFMASDAWHHLEGTYPKAGLFRAYFYDNFTKPIAAKEFSGSLAVLDQHDKELGSFQLGHAASGTLEAAIPVTLASLPLKAAVKVKFGSTIPEQRFDFFFSAYSKDPAVVTATPLTKRSGPGSPTAPNRPTTSTTRKGMPAANPPATGARVDPAVGAPPAAPGAARQAAAGAPKVAAPAAPTAAPPPATAASANAAPLVLDTPLNIPPALADALDESKLPTDTPGLLAELATRAKKVESLINEGSLAEVWLPANGTKTVALVLGRRAGALPQAVRSRAESAVKRIVVDSWALDNYGDLGSRDKIAVAYSDLAGAIAELKTAYAAAP